MIFMEKHFVVETLLPACKRERVDDANQAARGQLKQLVLQQGHTFHSHKNQKE